MSLQTANGQAIQAEETAVAKVLRQPRTCLWNSWNGIK